MRLKEPGGAGKAEAQVGGDAFQIFWQPFPNLNLNLNP
jgi:hypothetical protein